MTGVVDGAYVYEISVSGVVRYLGKGRGNRAESHLRIAGRMHRAASVGPKVRRSRFYKLLAQALVAGETVEVRYASSGLTDEAAFDLEREMILTAPFGQLWNSAPGGEGQDSAYLKSLMTEERRAALRAHAKAAWKANPERKNARFAEPGSRERQSQMARAKWSDPDYRAKQSAERSKPRPSRRGVVVAALSAPAKQRWADPEFKARASEAIRVAASKRTPEQRKAIAEKLASVRATPEYRAKLSASLKASHARRRAEKAAA